MSEREIGRERRRVSVCVCVKKEVAKGVHLKKRMHLSLSNVHILLILKS